MVDCSNFFQNMKSREIASEKFADIDQADDRSIVQLMINQIEFANVILLNKTDLVTDEEKAEVKNTILQLNSKALIIDTVKSNVDLDQVINTGKFNFEEAETNSKWLEKEVNYCCDKCE